MLSLNLLLIIPLCLDITAYVWNSIPSYHSYYVYSMFTTEPVSAKTSVFISKIPCSTVRSCNNNVTHYWLKLIAYRFRFDLIISDTHRVFSYWQWSVIFFMCFIVSWSCNFKCLLSDEFSTFLALGILLTLCLAPFKCKFEFENEFGWSVHVNLSAVWNIYCSYCYVNNEMCLYDIATPALSSHA